MNNEENEGAKLCTTSGRPVDVVREEQTEATGQYKDYIVLCPDERAKGFVRPVRQSYVHVGQKIEREDDGRRILGRLILIDEPDFPPNDYYTKEAGYGGYIKYPPEKAPALGKYITQSEVDAIINRQTHFGGCGASTRMGLSLAETYARDPTFYGSTFCVGCNQHLPVGEFVWSQDGEVVGS